MIRSEWKSKCQCDFKYRKKRSLTKEQKGTHSLINEQLSQKLDRM